MSGSYRVCSLSIVALLWALLSTPTSARCMPACDQNVPVYPATLDSRPPGMKSPCKTELGEERILAIDCRGRYTVVPVTVENSSIKLQYGGSSIGKGNQLAVDGDDFPTLARTGLHSVTELATARTITGKPVAAITEAGRPRRASGEGFLAEDEDIISVLRGDNLLVSALCMSHPRMAKPLFHVWNLLLREYELGRLGRSSNDIAEFEYNAKRIRIRAHPTRGFQESIFADEIRGAFEIDLQRDLAPDETRFLRRCYAELQPEEYEAFADRLTRIHTGEMEPYYIMRYGFYEGHTGYRVDPLAIAVIFGLKTIQEIEAALPGRLHQVLTRHYASFKAPSKSSIDRESGDGEVGTVYSIPFCEPSAKGN